MAISATNWLTVGLFYNEPWEELLAKAIKPYTDVVLQTGVAERFYFQRSRERGPHIRLWFKGTDFVLEQMLKPNLEEYFLQYFEARPSFLQRPNYPADFPVQFKWHPNNSVQFMGQLPALDRSGGKLEQLICEQVYQASSELVLEKLKSKSGKFTQDEKAGTAVKMHLSLLYAAGLNLQDAARFFGWMFENWESEANEKALRSANKTVKDPANRSFQAVFDLQKSDLVSNHAALWELLKNYRKTAEPLYVDWIHSCSSACLKVNLALDAGTLPAPMLKPMKNGSYPASAWSFYADFIMAANNQLGVMGKNEGYLFYSLANSLKLACEGSKSTTSMVLR